MARGRGGWAWGVVLGSAVLPLATVAGADDAAPVASVAPMPAPYRLALSADSADRARQNVECESCHAQEAVEWRGSQHARSDVDPVYRRALAIEPLPFCRGCHAPEVAPDPPQAASMLGVGCITCHVTDPASHATLASVTPSALIPVSPHATTRAASFDGDAACGGCHEFDFPNRRGVRMQSTISEHEAGTAKGVSCAACHMRSVGDGAARHRDHRFPASGDLAMLQSAVTVTAERSRDTAVVVTVTAAATGHAFPTGDLFRRVVVSAEAIDDDWTVHAEASRAIHRNFRWVTLSNGEHARTPDGDNRVTSDAPAHVVLDLGPRARGRAISYRVEYQRVEHPLDGQGEDRAVVAESTLLASGTLKAAR